MLLLKIDLNQSVQITVMISILKVTVSFLLTNGYTMMVTHSY